MLKVGKKFSHLTSIMAWEIWQESVWYSAIWQILNVQKIRSLLNFVFMHHTLHEFYYFDSKKVANKFLKYSKFCCLKVIKFPSGHSLTILFNHFFSCRQNDGSTTQQHLPSPVEASSINVLENASNACILLRSISSFCLRWLFCEQSK